MASSVLIVDDNQMVRKVVRHFFESLPDWKIGGEAGEGAEAVRKAAEVKPDLILLDFSMPNMNGVEAASVLKKMLPEVHIIVFTIYDDALGSSLVSAVGVDLVVPKAEGLTGLVKAVQRLMGTGGMIKDQAQPDRQEPLRELPALDSKRDKASSTREPPRASGLTDNLRGLMQGGTQERWKCLCEEAATEQDSQKLLELVREINVLIEAKQSRLKKKEADALTPDKRNSFLRPGHTPLVARDHNIIKDIEIKTTKKERIFRSIKLW
jgi:DNA-binding NarL/FixJ family response regulator